MKLGVSYSSPRFCKLREQATPINYPCKICVFPHVTCMCLCMPNCPCVDTPLAITMYRKRCTHLTNMFQDGDNIFLKIMYPLL